MRWVNVGQTSLVTQQTDRAVVYAELSYQLRNGQTQNDPQHYIQLTFDRATHGWLFWDKGTAPNFD